MQIGDRFSAHKNVHTGFSVLRELAAPSVPDDLAEGFLSSPEPVTALNNFFILQM